MSDVLQLFIATVVAPGISALVAYIVTRRRETSEVGKSNAEANAINADIADKYRKWLDAEMARRRLVEEQLDTMTDAMKELIDENELLRDENADLRKRIKRLIGADTNVE